jgi:hypothetical protein
MMLMMMFFVFLIVLFLGELRLNEPNLKISHLPLKIHKTKVSILYTPKTLITPILRFFVPFTTWFI